MHDRVGFTKKTEKIVQNLKSRYTSCPIRCLAREGVFENSSFVSLYVAL